MIFRISWKNVWRSRVRSLVVIAAVTVGMIGGMMGLALMEGMVVQRFDAIVNNETAHIQIHHKDFQKNTEAKYFLKDAAKMLSEIKQMEGVEYAVKRLKLNVAVQTPYALHNLTLLGINPADEKKISGIYKHLLDSSFNYFEDQKRNSILLGEQAAKSLKIVRYVLDEESLQTLKQSDMPDEVIQNLESIQSEDFFRTEKAFISFLEENMDEDNFTAYKFRIRNASKKYSLRSRITVNYKDTAGHDINERFRLKGLYKTSNALFDGSMAFVNEKDLAKQTGFSLNDAHEIAVLLKDIEQTDDFVKALKKKYPDVGIVSWSDLSPDLKMISEYMGAVNYVFIIIILFALGFGIVNTMLMVVLERIKELGMLMAIGMNKLRVFLMIMMETVFLSLVGGVVGVGISAVLISYFKNKGIVLNEDMGEVMETVGYASTLYPELSSDFYISVILLVVLTGIVAAIYPARKALKLNPADAVRSDV